MQLTKLINEVSEVLLQLSYTYPHKIWTYLGAIGTGLFTANSVIDLSDVWFIGWLIDVISSNSAAETVGFFALCLLFVERVFIVWAWVKRFRRGDYDEGKPND